MTRPSRLRPTRTVCCGKPLSNATFQLGSGLAFIQAQPFRWRGHCDVNTFIVLKVVVMNKIGPVLLALIPLAFTVSACVVTH